MQMIIRWVNEIPTQSLILANMTSSFLMDLLERLLPILLPRICTHKWILKEDRIPSSGILSTTDVTRKLMQTILYVNKNGWEMEVQWADGSTDWLPLKDLKDSNLIETALYAISNGISEEPAFSWWARHTLHKGDRFIKKVKTRYLGWLLRITVTVFY
jgi:hypothetical protein